MDGLIAGGLRVEEATAPYLVAPPLTEHLDTFASAPEGFKRLRELVLNLAVRGRLVPQDASDEPAEKLLGRMRKERAGLSSRREKVLDLIADDEVPYAVPSSWRWVRLPEICHDWGQKVPNGPFTYIDVGAISNERGVITDATQRLDETNAPSRARKIVRPGTVLYSTVRPYLLNIAIVGRAYESEAIASTAFAVLHPLTGIDGRFLFHYLRSQPFIDFVASKMAGVAYPAINDGNFFSGLFPLPPTAEQSRIVAKVEELMALIDRLEARVGVGETARGKLLDALLSALADSPDAATTADAWVQLAPHFDLLLQAPADVDRLQQTLLQLAVKGRLVPQDPEDEPAAELIKRIHAEKERLVAEGKIKRAKPLLAIAEGEQSFELPSGWRWARFGDVVLSSEAGWSPNCESVPREGNRWAVLKVSAVSWGDFRDMENKALPAHFEARPEYEVQAGDFLLSRANTAELVARSVVAWSPQPRLMLSDKIIRLNISSSADKAFLSLFNNSAFARAHYIAHASGTSSSMKNVSREVILSLPIPVPPLPEQSRIVAAVASLTALCDRLRGRLAARRDLTAKLAAALTESALA